MMEKVIGILGGMGPEATLSLFEKIVRNTPAEKDQDHLRIIIDNNPKIPDRTAAIVNQGENPVPEIVKSGKTLERAGADFIVIPCISAHFYLDDLKQKLNLPILSVFHEANILLANKYPQLSTIGLLATSGTIEGGRFQKCLKENEIETVIPSPQFQETVMFSIYSVKSDPYGRKRNETRERLIEVAEYLMEKGAQGIIAGCTEVPLVLSEKDVPIPFFDPLLILAKAAIREAVGNQVS